MTEYYPAASFEAAPVPTKKRKRIFMWVFLAVQVLFVIWIIGGVGSADTPSAADCGSLSAQTCQDAADVGTGIGVALIILLWFFVDCFLAVGYAVYRLARRP